MAPPIAPFKVLIVGGGIAGPTLAHWLSRMGASITLIERWPQMRATGQQVDLRGQGVQMMKQLGIEAAVRAACVREKGTQFIDRNGRTKAFFPAAENGSAKQSFTSEFEIMRADLVRILYRLTDGRPNVTHLFDTSITSLVQDDLNDPNGKVHVSFQDGRNDDFDLVVGADGTGSRTRRMMLGPDAPDPRHSRGGYIGYFSIPSDPADSNLATYCLLPGGTLSRTIATRKDCPDLTRVYMILRGNDAPLDAALKSGNLADLKTALADIYQDGGWECARFMEALRNAPEADDLYCTPLEEVRLPHGLWSKGRVVLVGDAAHSASADGYGTTWGLIGPYILAGEMAAAYAKDPSSSNSLSVTAIQEAAKKYEDVFRPIATAMHGGSNDWFEDLITPRSSFGISVLHTVARAMAYLRLDQMAGLSSKTSKWPLPHYPELDTEQSQEA